jgi:UDP-glucose 4-epimerase
MKVMVTGAGGFIGQKLCTVLEESGFDIVPVFRSHQSGCEKDLPAAVLSKTIDATTDWTNELIDIDVVVHLAARVHVMHGGDANDLSSFRDINAEGTRNIATQAAQAGVNRFIYLSSIKVNGEETTNRPFYFDQPPNPQDSYALSKMEAEDVLRKINETTGMGVVIIRPPLVYGPGVKGNMLALVNILRRGIPLPFGAIDNRRDLVSIYNLCDLIRVCLLHPAAPAHTFLASDNESISTADLIRYIADGLKRNARVFSVPTWMLKLLAGFVGKRKELEKLTGNLQIDSSPTRQVLDWHPPLTVGDSFRKMFTEG